MPKLKTFSHEDIERVRTMLAQAPEKPKSPPPLTAREMIVAMSSEISDLQKRGYELGEIAEMIRCGFNLDSLSASTLKQYLLQKKRKTIRKPKSSSPAPQKRTEARAENLSTADLRSDA